MIQDAYTSSFTVAALLYQEFMASKDILQQENFVELINQERKENKFLGIKTEIGRKRVVTEIKKRYAVVDKVFWEYFSEQSSTEQKLSLFYTALKAYLLAFDLHFEVVVKKWKTLDTQLELFDLQMRIDELSSMHEQIDSWSESTKRKLLTNYMRMLREAGLMQKNTLTKPVGVSDDFWKYYVKKGEVWFLEACFLSKQERENYL